jgi:transcriptional regulator with XRE-family HTH domain
MDGASQIREWLEAALRERGMTVEGLAKKSGVHKATIHRAMSPGYQHVTSTRTLQKLATALGVDAPSTLTQVKLAPLLLPVRYKVQAGLWFEIDAEEPPEQIQLGVLPDPRFAKAPQWLEKVVGDSVDLKIPPGHYAHVIDAIEIGYAPRDGDWVVVERRRDQGGTRERTIKQVAVKNGLVQLWPRSRNPKWAEPIDLCAGARSGDIEVEIVGLVVGAYDASF